MSRRSTAERPVPIQEIDDALARVSGSSRDAVDNIDSERAALSAVEEAAFRDLRYRFGRRDV